MLSSVIRLTLLIPLLCSQLLLAQSLVLDKPASSIGFHLKQFGLGQVEGFFKDFQVDLSRTGTIIDSVRVTIDVKTVHTDSKTRDRHLLKEEFFDQKQFPVIRYESQMPVTPNSQYSEGALTIKGVSQTVQVPIQIKWQEKSLIVTSDTFSFDRSEYGLKSHPRMIDKRVNLRLQLIFREEER